MYFISFNEKQASLAIRSIHQCIPLFWFDTFIMMAFTLNECKIYLYIQNMWKCVLNFLDILCFKHFILSTYPTINYSEIIKNCFNYCFWLNARFNNQIKILLCVIEGIIRLYTFQRTNLGCTPVIIVLKTNYFNLLWSLSWILDSKLQCSTLTCMCHVKIVIHYLIS